MVVPKLNHSVLTHDFKEVKNLSTRMWKFNNEQLFIGNIPINEIDTNDREAVNSYLKDYFDNNKFLFPIETINVNSGEELFVELVCKATFLCKEYLRDGNFRDPLCTHYNPILHTNVIHPGGTRQIILDLFHEADIYSFYFNTKNHSPSFLSKLRQINSLDEIKTYHIGLVPDHGTLIPHILNHDTGVEKLPSNMIETHNFIKERFSNRKFKIYTNLPIDHFQKWRAKRKKHATVSVNFKDNKIDLKDKLKATYLVLSAQNYEDKTIRVTHK